MTKKSTSNADELPSQSNLPPIRIAARGAGHALFYGSSEVLIGQTVLESLDLFVDCLTHRVIGNPAHPDQPIIKIKGILESPGISRVAVHS